MKGRNASKLSGKRDAKAPSKVLETSRGSSAGKAGTELNKVLKSLMVNSSEPGSSGPGPSSMAIDELSKVYPIMTLIILSTPRKAPGEHTCYSTQIKRGGRVVDWK